MTIFSLYPDQEACIEHLEKVRWHDEPNCPYCGSDNVARKAENTRIGRWNCRACRSSFNVLSGTIFEKTKVELQKWFLAVGLVVNAKKSLSSYQLGRDLELNQKTAWYMQQRIRAAMAAEQAPMLQGIVEADETYVGGKPRKGKRRDDDGPGAPRGRATRKTPVIGAVERGGSVVARVADDLTGKGIIRFLKNSVDPIGSLLITDEYKGYNAAKSRYNHAVINHSEAYADGDTHTNTIEGFWSLIKRAWYGSHHHYTKHWGIIYLTARANRL
jgi:transposase-like protein